MVRTNAIRRELPTGLYGFASLYAVVNFFDPAVAILYIIAKI